jgi:hypothetical protein
MSIIDNAKEIADLIKKVGDIDLYRKIVELQGELVQLSNRNFELEKKCAELQASVDRKKALRHLRSLVFEDGDAVPFCPRCAEATGKLIHLFTVKMASEEIERWECHVCHLEFTAQSKGDFTARQPKRY